MKNFGDFLKIMSDAESSGEAYENEQMVVSKLESAGVPEPDATFMRSKAFTMFALKKYHEWMSES